MCLEFQIDGNLLVCECAYPPRWRSDSAIRNLVYDLVERTVKDARSGRELIPEVTLDTPARKPIATQTSESRSQMSTSGMPEQRVSTPHHKNEPTAGSGQ